MVLYRLPTPLKTIQAAVWVVLLLFLAPFLGTKNAFPSCTAQEELPNPRESDKDNGDVLRIAYCAVQICTDVPWYYPLFTHTFRAATSSHDGHPNTEIDFYMLRVLPDDNGGDDAATTPLLREQRKTMCGNVGENWMQADDGKTMEPTTQNNLTKIDGIAEIRKNDAEKSFGRRQNVFYKEVTDAWFRQALETRVFGSGACGDRNTEEDDVLDERLFSETTIGGPNPLRNDAYWVYRLFGPQLFLEEWFDEVPDLDDEEQQKRDDASGRGDDDNNIIVSMLFPEGGEGESSKKKKTTTKYYKPRYTHWGYLDYDMVFSNKFPGRIYDLYRDSKRKFAHGLPPDIMTFPDQQGHQLFLAGQNTIYAMTRPTKPLPSLGGKTTTNNKSNDDDDGANSSSPGAKLRQMYRQLDTVRPKRETPPKTTTQEQPQQFASRTNTTATRMVVRELYRPFRLSKCASLFDSDTDSLDEVQASLTALAGLGESPRMAFDFGAQREAYDVTHNRWNLHLELSRTRQTQNDRNVHDERAAIGLERTERGGPGAFAPPEGVTFRMLRDHFVTTDQNFWGQTAVEMMQSLRASSPYCYEVRVRNEISNDEHVRKELNRLYCGHPIELKTMTWFGSRYLVGDLLPDDDDDDGNFFDAKQELDLIVTKALLPPTTVEDDHNDYDKALRRGEDLPSFFHWHRNLKSWLPKPFCSPQFESVLYRLNGYITDDVRFRSRNEAVVVTIGWYDDIYNGMQQCPMLSMREIPAAGGDAATGGGDEL